MRFVTFQPKVVDYTICKEGVYNAPENETLLNKIFCIKVDENIMERLFMCAPSFPQTAIIFETDEYEELDSVAWVNKLHLGLNKDLDTKYKEYLVDKIEKSQVIKVIDISDSTDPDKVQDDFMDKHFRQFEKLSGYKWDRICDNPDLCGTYESYKLCSQMQLIMTPFKEVTEKDFDETVELVRELFRKEKIQKTNM